MNPISVPMLDPLNCTRYTPRRRERGQAVILSLMVMGVAAGLIVYNLVTPAAQGIQRDKITAAALAQAKLALIGYAAGVNLTGGAERPGDLPCPDLDDSGSPAGSCGNAAGTTGQTLRIGRLPWRYLGLPDLRDGDGERLWYAVSNNFKYNTRTACAAPGAAGCLNSDARGTITVRDSAGNVVNDGTNPDPFTPSGVIAVIFSPGAVLQRQGAAAPQDRSCTGDSNVPICQATGVCTGPTYTTTALCNPVNYLDILTGVEDNADFTDGSNTNGFINGVVRDASNNVVVNDRLLLITYQDLMPVLQRRVATEVLNCLTDYASVPQNKGRYPWAVPVTNVPEPYADKVNTTFGRVPDTLSDTQLGLAGGVANLVCLIPALCMTSSWPGTCNITLGSWWENWKEMVFYGVADGYKPADPLSLILPVPNPGCGACLTINNDTPTPYVNKRVAVIVAGKRLAGVAGGQPRTTGANKGTSTNYLEVDNDGGTNTTQNTLGQQSTTASFNDLLLYQ